MPSLSRAVTDCLACAPPLRCRYINYKDNVPRLPSADAHVGQQYYLDGVEQSSAGMCALAAPGSDIPDYCTDAHWANGSSVLGSILNAVGELAAASMPACPARHAALLERH